jgi:flagellar protein FliS
MHLASRYERTRNETASRERLMVLLFETALRHIRAGATALETGREAEAAAPLCKATDIVAHLEATFDRARLPALADSLGAVYRFTCQRLIAAIATRDPVPAREAEVAFCPIVEAFALAVQETAGGTP